MKKIVIVTGALLCFSVGGCSTNPKMAYSKIEGASTAYTLTDAALRAPSTIQIGAQQRLYLSEDSPVLRDGNVTGSFQHFTLPLSHPEKTTLEIQSYCDCIGLNKYVMVPRLFLRTSSGAVTELAPTTRRYESPGWIDPASITSAWEAPLEAGSNDLLLVADTRAIGGEVIQVTTQTMIAAGGIFVPITGALQLVAYPYGKYDVRVKEEK